MKKEFRADWDEGSNVEVFRFDDTDGKAKWFSGEVEIVDRYTMGNSDNDLLTVNYLALEYKEGILHTVPKKVHLKRNDLKIRPRKWNLSESWHVKK